MTNRKVKSTNKLPSFAEALNGEEDDDLPETLLNGPVPADTYLSMESLARYLGLQTTKAVEEFMVSPQFLPFYNRLYDVVIQPRRRSTTRKQGPQFLQVQCELRRGESDGREKYSGYDVNPQNFTTDLENYAFCLCRLKHVNLRSHNGIFLGKQISEEEAESRLWQVMLRATKDRAKTSKKSSKVGKRSAKPPTSAAIVDESEDCTDSLFIPDSQPVDEEDDSDDIYDPPKRRKTTLQKKATPDSASAMSPSPNFAESEGSPSQIRSSRQLFAFRPSQQPLPNTESSPRPAPSNDNPDQQQSNTGPQTTCIRQAESAALDDCAGEPPISVDQPDPAQEEDSRDDHSIGADHDIMISEGTPEPEEDQVIPEDSQGPMDILLATMNHQNPFDMATPYGKYATIHLVASNFRDKPRLAKLVNPPVFDAQSEANAQNGLRAIWLREIEAMIHEKRLRLPSTSAYDSAQLENMEKLLDNKSLQPMDYEKACTQLGIGDKDRPRIKGMMFTKVLKSWQVTGIARALEIYKRRTVKAAFFADSTGLGKTYQILGFILHVSRFQRRLLQ